MQSASFIILDKVFLKHSYCIKTVLYMRNNIRGDFGILLNNLLAVLIRDFAQVFSTV